MGKINCAMEIKKLVYSTDSGETLQEEAQEHAQKILNIGR